MNFNQQPQQVQKIQNTQEGNSVELPIDARRDLILEKIHNNESVIIVGETGSGKTTRVPVFLLETFPDKKIAVTSPRVLPARSVSRFVASSRGGVVGGEVGLITREFREVSKETVATFMTDGILLSMLRKDPMLLECDIVMVDEAHERSINIDLALGLLKQAQKLRKEAGKEELKIIVTSATIEEEKFATYFDKSPVVKVEGRTYPVEVFYNSFSSGDRDIIESSADKVKEIVDTTTEGDILIFMPGEEEINQTIRYISEKIKEDVTFLPLYGAMNPKDQDRVFVRNGKRRIIVSTNIAETSVTIDGISYVVDAGYAKQKNYNPQTGIHSLDLVPIAKANMDQRKGRAGRTAPGTCYRLISRAEFESRPDFQKPELLRSDLGEVVLRMIDMGIKDVEGFDFIDKPSIASIHDAIDNLKNLGALNEKGEITEIGKEMSRLELRPDLARMLIEAKHIGCLEDMVDLCSLLSASKQLMIRPKEDADSPEERHKQFTQMEKQQKLRVPGSDPLTLLKIWDAWVDSGYSKAFAFNHLLNIKALQEVGLTRTQLLKTLAQGGVEVGARKEHIDKIGVLRCLLAGAPNALFVSGDIGKSYSPVRGDPYLYGTRVFPGSSAFKERKELILALNIQRSEKEVTNNWGERERRSTLYARTCQVVTIDDLKQVIPMHVEEKPVGTVQRDPYSDVLYQRYDVYIYGRVVSSTQKEVNVEGLSLEAQFGTFSRAISALLPDVAFRNDGVTRVYEQWVVRAGGSLLKKDKEDIYRKKIEEHNIITVKELEEHKEQFVLSLDDFISVEERETIERESPKTIYVAGQHFSVSYQDTLFGKNRFKRVIELFSKEDVRCILDNKDEIPTDLKSRDMWFKYDYRIYYNITELETVFHRPESQSFVASTLYRNSLAQEPVKTTLGDILKSKMEKQKQEKEETRSQQPTHVEAFVVEKKPVTAEKKLEYKNTLSDIKILSKQIRDVVEVVSPKVLKTKDNVLQRLKDISSDCNSFIKTIESDIPLTVESVDGKIAQFQQTLKVTMKLSGLFSGEIMEKPLQVFQANKEALQKAAGRNDVVFEGDLVDRVNKKSAELAIQKKLTITNDEADAILIELV